MARVTVLVLLAQWFFGKYKAFYSGFLLSLSSNQNMQVIIYWDVQRNLTNCYVASSTCSRTRQDTQTPTSWLTSHFSE